MKKDKCIQCQNPHFDVLCTCNKPEGDKVSVDMTCCNCGHSPESHHAGKGQCYRCEASQRCPGWRPKSKQALEVSNNRNPWGSIFEDVENE